MLILVAQLIIKLTVKKNLEIHQFQKHKNIENLSNLSIYSDIGSYTQKFTELLEKIIISKKMYLFIFLSGTLSPEKAFFSSTCCVTKKCLRFPNSVLKTKYLILFIND